MNERGFLSGLALYAVLGLGAATVLAGGWGWIQGKRLAAAQESLEACKSTNLVLNAQITRQNEGVKALQKASQEAQERGKAALVKAEQGAIANRREVERLRASKPVSVECPAGEAVKQIRKGLG